MYTVAIVGEQAVPRAGLVKLASEDPSLDVVAAVDSLDSLDDLDAGPYDIVVLDLPLRVPCSTLDAIGKVAAVSRPLLSSSWEHQPTLLATIRAGARGCITRHTDEHGVREALRVVAQGGFYLCPRLVGQFQQELARPADDEQNGLAPREIETLRWIALGFTHAQIATRMGLSQATVNTYAKRIRVKLNVSNKAQLTRMAIELGHVSRGRAA